MDFEVSFDYDGEDEKEYWVEAKCKFVTDKHHGADADGNRGESRTFMEDFDIHVWPSEKDGKGIEIPWEKMPSEDRKEIERIATNKLDDEAASWEGWDGDCDDKDD